MNDARLAELREKYKNRNLLEELAWGIYADHSGYTTKQNGEFLNWLCNMAYRAVKGQQKAVPLDRIKRAREEIEDRIDNYPDRNISEYEDCLAILDKLIAEVEG